MGSFQSVENDMGEGFEMWVADLCPAGSKYKTWSSIAAPAGSPSPIGDVGVKDNREEFAVKVVKSCQMLRSFGVKNPSSCLVNIYEKLRADRTAGDCSVLNVLVEHGIHGNPMEGTGWSKEKGFRGESDGGPLQHVLQSLQNTFPEQMLTPSRAAEHYAKQRLIFRDTILSTITVPEAWANYKDMIGAERFTKMVELGKNLTMDMLELRDAVRIRRYHNMGCGWRIYWTKKGPEVSNPVGPSCTKQFEKAKATAKLMLGEFELALEEAYQRIRERSKTKVLGDLSVRGKTSSNPRHKQHVPKCFQGFGSCFHGKQAKLLPSELDPEVQQVFKDYLQKGKTDRGSLNEKENTWSNIAGTWAGKWEHQRHLTYSQYHYARVGLIAQGFLACVEDTLRALPGKFMSPSTKGFQRSWTKCREDYSGKDYPPPAFQYLKDCNRCTKIMRNLDDVGQAMDKLAACPDMEVTGVKDRLKDSTHDVLINVIYQDMICEVQLHFQEIMNLKKLTHKPYNVVRLQGNCDLISKGNTHPEECKILKAGVVFEEFLGKI